MLIVSVILLQIFIFTGLVFFLRQILNRNVTSATSHLEQLSTEYAKKEAEIKKQLAETQQQCKQMLEKSRAETEQQRKDSVTKLEEEKSKILVDAKQRAEQIVRQAEKTRQALIDEIEQKIGDASIKNAVELVQQALPEHIRQQIHHHWLGELTSGSVKQLDRLHIPKGIQEARVISAFALTADERRGLKEKIMQKLGHKLELKEEVDAKLIVGLIINIGSLVLDGSLRFKIQEVTSAIDSK